MHTAGKVLLILGGIITVFGIVLIVGGAAAADFDPSEEYVDKGTSGEFPASDSGLGFSVWVSESVACDTVSMTVLDDSGEDMYYDTCWSSEPNEDDGVDDYYSIGGVGLLDDEGGTYTWEVSSGQTVYIVDSGDELGEAVTGIFAALGGILVAICGGVLLLIGLILALTLKSKEPAVVMQQGGQMMGGQMMQQPMQQMQQPVQQMQQPVQQTTQQAYEFEQK
jgi:hypothetical protein